MSGSIKLSEEEKQEMVLDAKNGNRAKAFHSARILSQKGSLDDYIDFLSENIKEKLNTLNYSHHS